MKTAYLISNIEEYGKFIAFCIDNDISVWRTYWNEREKYCFNINWKEKRCYYSSKQYYLNEDYVLKTPNFEIDEYGKYKLIKE